MNDEKLKAKEIVKYVVSAFIIAMVFSAGIGLGSIGAGMLARHVNKTITVDEQHNRLMQSHSWNYCPYCGELLDEDEPATATE